MGTELMMRDRDLLVLYNRVMSECIKTNEILNDGYLPKFWEICYVEQIFTITMLWRKSYEKKQR